MKVIDPGHTYLLDILDKDYVVLYDRIRVPIRYSHGVLEFVKREGEKYPGNVGKHPGTLIQEVLRCCIDRLKYLDKQEPHWVNGGCINLLRSCIRILEIRAWHRHDRDPTYLKEFEIELLPTNSHGHLWKETDESDIPTQQSR